MADVKASLTITETLAVVVVTDVLVVSVTGSDS
jgi:hypothetical protein